MTVCELFHNTVILTSHKGHYVPILRHNILLLNDLARMSSCPAPLVNKVSNEHNENLLHIDI
jgi:hypothetical protein